MPTQRNRRSDHSVEVRTDRSNGLATDPHQVLQVIDDHVDRNRRAAEERLLQHDADAPAGFEIART
jgi:hypothetical protein